ncbi:MAG: hypothetical protein ACYC5K_02920 [Saccharofermentanales bacterium]
MTSVFLAFDSLKFYKLKSENTARGLFVIVYLLFLGFSAFPIGKPIDINALYEMLQSGKITSYPQITGANIYHYASLLVFTVLMSYFSLMYATCFVMEHDGFPGKKGIISTLRQLPRLLSYILILTVPALISSIFLFIPMIYLYYALFFAPVLITEGKKGIFEAMIESYKVSRGFKINIFFTQMLIYFILNIPISLFASGFLYSGNDNTMAEYLVMSFLSAAQVLITGRMIGNYYMIAVKNQGNIKKIIDDIENSEKEKSSDDE